MYQFIKVLLTLPVIGFGLLLGAHANAETPTATEVAKLVANDGALGDYFGYSVAVDGDTAVIGAF